MADKPKEPLIVSSTTPLHCPRVEDQLWNQHPRVFLEFNEQGEAVCPYCSMRYLAGGAKKAAH